MPSLQHFKMLFSSAVIVVTVKGFLLFVHFKCPFVSIFDRLRFIFLWLTLLRVDSFGVYSIEYKCIAFDEFPFFFLVLFFLSVHLSLSVYVFLLIFNCHCIIFYYLEANDDSSMCKYGYSISKYAAIKE